MIGDSDLSPQKNSESIQLVLTILGQFNHTFDTVSIFTFELRILAFQRHCPTPEIFEGQGNTFLRYPSPFETAARNI
jgi:hypothetical protein